MGVIATLQNKATLRNRFEAATAEYIRGDIMPLVIAPDEYQLRESQKLAWEMVRHVDAGHPNFENAQIRISRNMLQAFTSARHSFDANKPHEYIRNEFRAAITHLVEDAADYLAQKPGSNKSAPWKLAR
ncbi:MAG: hypothetical protein DI626_01320 [Micavibrio aeruginosavorus]|uniref:Uncharacterized protein n=1 Tax=Micavibrio aeruginosavorus TaxID=349221 RepID=A0A2W5A800_9BACT|nr:MAG: hypothetical protein DI626_01320 [Micavibrio aeruginosavorus]